MTMTHVVQQQITCKTAQEFLGALSPLGSHFIDCKPTDPWLFRGQGGDYSLIPSAFRNDGKFAALTHLDITDYGNRLLAERDILADFFELADKRGLVLPDDSQQLRELLETLKSDRGDHLVITGDDEWQPASAARSLTALVQHYGVPTRLLDWSRHPYIAAFFAAEGGMSRIEKGDSSGYIVVWSFYFPKLGKHDAIERNSDPVSVVTAPSATNTNLQAQQGVFTLINPVYSGEKQGSYATLDAMLEKEANKAIKRNAPDPTPSERLVLDCKMQKFTVPTLEAPKVLYLLAKWDITVSSIYPGYNSIARELGMRARWR